MGSGMRSTTPPRASTRWTPPTHRSLCLSDAVGCWCPCTRPELQRRCFLARGASPPPLASKCQPQVRVGSHTCVVCCVAQLLRLWRVWRVGLSWCAPMSPIPNDPAPRTHHRTSRTHHPALHTVDLATWLVVSSTLHPRFRDSPVLTDMEMGGFDDPTTQVRGLCIHTHPPALQRSATTHTHHTLALVVRCVADDVLHLPWRESHGSRVTSVYRGWRWCRSL